MTEGKRLTPRAQLVATVAVMKFLGGNLGFVFQEAEAWVAELEAEPDKPVKCPCCTTDVTLCLKHYQLHEPGKKCGGCLSEEVNIYAPDAETLADPLAVLTAPDPGVKGWDY